MESFLFGPELIPFAELFLAMVLGMAIGIERSLAGKVAGMRTFGLVALGSCFFVIIPEVAPIIAQSGNYEFDPFRVAAGVITGIGFIGGGLILYHKERRLTGLTTAAGLWVAAGVGMAVGFNLYALAIFTSLLTVLTFTAMWYVERYIEEHVSIQKPHGEVVMEHLGSPVKDSEGHAHSSRRM